jgi:hypothetical protein
MRAPFSALIVGTCAVASLVMLGCAGTGGEVVSVEAQGSPEITVVRTDGTDAAGSLKETVRAPLGVWQEMEKCGPRLVRDVIGGNPDGHIVFFGSECAESSCFGTWWVAPPEGSESVVCTALSGTSRLYLSS